MLCTFGKMLLIFMFSLGFLTFAADETNQLDRGHLTACGKSLSLEGPTQTPHLPQIGVFKTPFDGREIVYWEDPRSLQWLSRASANKAYIKLTRFYETQSDKFMCGPASISVVLNAIKFGSGLPLPLDLEQETFARSINPSLPVNYQASFPRYTQRNIFQVGNPKTKGLSQVYGVPSSDGHVSPGLNLQEMQEILSAHNVSSKIHYVTDASSSDYHRDVISHALNTEDHYVIANFDRAVWGLQGAGHISPLGAYDAISNKIFIVDVNIYGKWLWIDFDLFLKSMASRDNGMPRGYLIISPQSE
jgi:hypothetical protein